FAPALVDYTDDVLFGDVWKDAALAPRDRSLVTVACLVTSGNTDQLVYHLRLRQGQRRHRAGALTHQKCARGGVR
ncbi:MAG: carboxymuconolactone decarboxylase family protein, partial [Dermatophilaceae bacterium]